MRLGGHAAAVLAGAIAIGAGVSAQTVQINGAGATFPNPIYSKWFSEYNKLHPNVQINYQPLGSGAGIRQLTSRTVFFGATDTVDAAEVGLVAAVRELTGGGVDHGIEVVGKPATIRAAYAATRRGGTVTLVGAAGLTSRR